MPKTRILVASSDAEVINLISPALSTSYSLRTVPSDAEFFKFLWMFEPDLILFDLDFSASGAEFLRMARDDPGAQSLPVLALSADHAEKVLLEAFRSGADDFMPKPIKPVELAARVGALLRRRERAEAPGVKLELNRILLDTSAHQVTANGRALELTRTEFMLLEQLMRSAGKVFSKETLIAGVWGTVQDVRTHTLDSHIFNLRKKLGRLARLIRTVYGIGYSFKG